MQLFALPSLQAAAAPSASSFDIVVFDFYVAPEGTCCVH